MTDDQPIRAGIRAVIRGLADDDAAGVADLCTRLRAMLAAQPPAPLPAAYLKLVDVLAELADIA